MAIIKKSRSSNEESQREIRENIPVTTASKRIILNSREGAGEREPSYTVGGNVNWGNHYGKQSRGSSKIELPYDPTILLLGINPEKTIV